MSAAVELFCEERGSRCFWWLGSHAGVVARDARRAGFAKAEAELRALQEA